MTSIEKELAGGLMESSADGTLSKDAETKMIAAAHVHATLYVGEQLEILARMVRAGFKISRNGDTFGDETRWVEPGDDS